MRPKVSIITLTYNGLNVLKPCVESILKHCADVNFEWIIRENGSNDGSLAYLESLDTVKDVKIMDCENVGNFSSMNNLCVDYAEGDYLLFLNNDTEANSDFITPMVDLLDDPQVGVVGSLLHYPNGKVQHGGIVFDHHKNAHNLSSLFSSRNNLNIDNITMYDRIYQTVTGASFMCRKSDFIAVGKFNEEYNWCYDDVDLGLSITNKLNKIAVVSKDSKLIHHESWSDAKPENWDAIRLLRRYHGKDIKPDFFKYSNIHYNLYKRKVNND